MRNWNKDVGDFHRKIKYPEAQFPTIKPEVNLTHRIQHMHEELREYREAVLEGELPAAVDAMVDLIYLAIGTVRAHGVDINPCWDLVQEANMKKLPGDNWKNTTKPDDWEAPDLAKVIYDRPVQ